MMRLPVGTVGLLAALLAGPAIAHDDPAYDRFFILPDVSTLGAGIEVGARVNEHWQARAAVNGFATNFVYHASDSDLHSRLKLLSAGVTVDYFPHAGNFYVSGGLRLSGNRLEGSVRNLNGKLKNGSRVFVADPLTDFTVTQNLVQPYLGTGYTVKVGERVSLNLDLGALYAGTPDLDVDSRAHRLGFSRRDIRREIERAQDRVSPFKVYPVVQVGLKVRF